jgi:hypothetical protein
MEKQDRPIRGIISLVIILILLMEQTGCVTSNEIARDNLPAYYPRYAYAVHYRKSVYIMEKIGVRNDTLSGKIFNPDWEVLTANKFIHIYPSSDSLVRIDSAKILCIPLSGIEKVKSIEKARGKTTALVLGSVGVVLILLFVISFASMDLSMHLNIK